MAKLTNEQKKRIAKIGTITLSYKDGSSPLHLEDLGLILDIENLNEELPEQKRSNVSIPGRNGVLDTTYLLTDAPVFENRSLEYVFKAYSSFIDRAEINTKLINAFHGQEVKAVTSWHSDRYWLGNCSIEVKYSSTTCIEITVKIDAEPYAYDNIVTQQIIKVSGTSKFTLGNGSMWLEPVCYATASMDVVANGKHTTITGAHDTYDTLYLKTGNNKITATGNGTLTFEYRKGWL